MAAKLSLAALAAACLLAAPAASEDWAPLFNGKDLTGWVPKFAGHTLGENYKNTFRVEDGLLRVDYSNYTAFKGEFGHLFYEKPFGAYKLRLEYRFHGDQVSGGPDWAFRNNGAMVLAQAPETMALGQDFPVSIEFQFLGQVVDGADRPSGAVCTPGTNIERGGRLLTEHCIASNAATVRGDDWVKAEIHVLPDGHIRHFIGGVEVLAYDAPQLDPTDGDARPILKSGMPIKLTGGYIALQAESHPTDFRAIEILELKPD